MVDRHSSGLVGLLQPGSKIVGSEPPRCWRGCSDGAGCALRGFAAYLMVERGDRYRRMENSFFGRFVTVSFEEIDDLDVGHL